jgi:hypothetical protein
MKIGKNRFQRFVPKMGRLFWWGLRYQKNSAQMTHRAAAHVPIRHLQPGHLLPHDAYRDQDSVF